MKFRRPMVENKGWTWWLGCTLSLCLLLGAIAYWASIWLAPAVRIAPAGSLSDQSGQINLGQAQGLFGQIITAAPQIAVAPPSNIKVLGILAAGQKGSAVLAIDGKPGKVYMLGDTVDGQLKLVSVDIRQITLGQDGGTNRQTLAAPPKSEVSILTQGPSKASGSASPSATPAAFQIPGSGQAPNPSNPITPPPASILSPPPVINPGIMTNPSATMPPPNGPPPTGAPPPQ